MMQTIRQQMIAMLSKEAMGARELSQALGISEKMVFDHLPHLARTVKKAGYNLGMHPSRCRSCDYVFKERRRFTRPGRCPQCKGSHIQVPLYYVDGTHDDK